MNMILTPLFTPPIDSDYDFYEKGLVKTPVPANDRIDPLFKANIKDFWTYYCCGQYLKVSNRFLQWGYNFWYTTSKEYVMNIIEET